MASEKEGRRGRGTAALFGRMNILPLSHAVGFSTAPQTPPYPFLLDHMHPSYSLYFQALCNTIAPLRAHPRRASIPLRYMDYLWRGVLLSNSPFVSTSDLTDFCCCLFSMRFVPMLSCCSSSGSSLCYLVLREPLLSQVHVPGRDRQALSDKALPRLELRLPLGCHPRSSATSTCANGLARHAISSWRLLSLASLHQPPGLGGECS